MKVEIGNATLYLGDCLGTLKNFSDSSIDSIVTDPPYGLSFMGKKWDYDVPNMEVWSECLRVLKPGGHLLAFAGTRTQHRMAVRIEDAGFEIRDMIAWVYGSGFPKSHNLKDDWQGWGTALKPALEPITVARKPLIGTVAENVLAHGTGALNIDGCRVPHDEECRMMAPSQANIDNQSEKHRQAGRRTAVLELKPEGRWPANLIHDGSDEVLAVFPQSKDGVAGKRTGQNGVGNWGYAAQDKEWGGYGGGGSAARFFYCAKASKRDRDEGLDGFPTSVQQSVAHGERQYGTLPYTGEQREIKPRPRANIHPTVKPTDLMRYLCRLVTPPGGVVLDPFMGSGSTGKAAALEGFQFVGIEREAEYLEICKARIASSAELNVTQSEPPQADLFSEAA